LAGVFDLLLVTVNVPLDWDALIASLALNGRLHVVGFVLEPIPPSTVPLANGSEHERLPLPVDEGVAYNTVDTRPF